MGRNNEDQLGKIYDALGYPDLEKYLKKHDLTLSKDQKKYINSKYFLTFLTF